MKWSGLPVLVTGAGGFIGSGLCEQLIRQGAKVRAFVRYNSKNSHGSLDWLPQGVKRQIEVVAGDIRSPEGVAKVMQGVDYVFHLAALIAIPYSYVDPRHYVETNVIGALNVLTAARNLELKKIVFTSTSEVFGTARYVPIDENHPLQGQSPYAASKIASDKLAQSFYCSFNVPVVTLRPFNTYGPRQSARAIIPTIILQALAGTTIRLGSLHPKRDFTYVDDTVEGFLQAAAIGPVGEDINIGNGKEISVGELVTVIGKILNKPLEVEQETARVRPEDSEVEQLLAGTVKAQQLLKWSPNTSLEEGLKQTASWIQEKGHLFNQALTYAI